MRRFFVLLVLVMLLPVPGCGSRVGRVHGKATLDGQPLAGAEVTFWSADNPAYSATTGPDGSYEIYRDPRPEAGLKLGRYVVLVARYTRPKGEVKEDVAVPPEQEGVLPGTRNTLPFVYNDREKCPFQVELKSGDNEVNLDLKSRP
jgi:hypothetical protein